MRHWGLKCEQCGDVSPHWWPDSEGKETVRMVALLWPQLWALMQAFEPYRWIKIDILSFTAGDSIDEFLLNHHEHDALVLHNERGETEPLQHTIEISFR